MSFASVSHRPYGSYQDSDSDEFDYDYLRTSAQPLRQDQYEPIERISRETITRSNYNRADDERLSAVINNIACAAGIIGGIALGIKTGIVIAIGTAIVLHGGRRNPKIYGFVESSIKRMVAGVKAWINKNGPAIKKTVNQVKAKGKERFENGFETLREAVLPPKKTLWGRFKQSVREFGSDALKKIDKIHQTLDGVTLSLADEINDL